MDDSDKCDAEVVIKQDWLERLLISQKCLNGCHITAITYNLNV